MSTLEVYGDPAGHSAMARTVGLPCDITTQLRWTEYWGCMRCIRRIMWTYVAGVGEARAGAS
jgi:hypothetical protein